MMKFTTLTMSVLLVCLVGVCAQAGMLEIEYPMGTEVEYTRIITENFDHSSQVSIWVENVPNPDRWKEWRIEIWLPEAADPGRLTIDVDYDDTVDHSQPIEIFPVELGPAPGDPIWDFLPVGYYADTREAQWEFDGTAPVTETGHPHPWGNPWWVSFHFELPEGIPWGLHIYDECIPEPATLGLLLLGGLALFRYRRSA